MYVVVHITQDSPNLLVVEIETSRDVDVVKVRNTINKVSNLSS